MKGNNISRICVIGAGSWGTALANLLAEKDIAVDLWVREEDVFNQITEDRINHTFLPGIHLSSNLTPVKTFEAALSEKEMALIVVPSHVMREVLDGMKPYLNSSVSLMIATKGIENKTLMVMSQVAESILPKEFLENFSCLSGPSFAKEVAVKSPTAVTIASRDAVHLEKLQRLFTCEFFRVYTSFDLVGVQLGGALKNVIAIAAGISDGLGFGHNARAALITRGLAEITRLGVSMGAKPMTFSGLAGMGDLVLTCTGDLSRNRTVGMKLGKGMKLDEITDRMSMVAEGVKTTMSAYNLARKMHVDMPITNQVYSVLYEGKDPRDAVRDLMTRKLKPELEY